MAAVTVIQGQHVELTFSTTGLDYDVLKVEVASDGLTVLTYTSPQQSGTKELIVADSTAKAVLTSNDTVTMSYTTSMKQH